MFSTKILIMRPDEVHQTRTVELPDKPGYMAPLKAHQAFVAALAKIVEPITGEPMEHVTVFSDFSGGTNYKYLDMFVNENSAISSPPMPVNGAATDIYRRNVLVHEPGNYRAEDLPAIYGPAVLFEKVVWQ